MLIEIFSDVICPWCFIGKRRLDRVLDGPLGEGVALRWRPFQLYPDLPLDGVDRRTLLTRRYGDKADPARIPERIRVEAEMEGIQLRFDLMQRTPNTLLAHRVLEFAADAGLQHQLAEALFVAYFCQGSDVGDRMTLLDVAVEVGLDRTALDTYLQSGGGVDSIATQLARAPELGVSGVPGYYLADAFLLPGAQSAETMTQIIERVKQKLGT